MNKTPRSRIAQIIAKRSLEPVSSEELGREIAAYLLTERRTGEVESLLRDILQYRAEHGIVEARASSAFPLTGKIRADLISQLQEMYPDAKQIIISEQHDPELIGGIRLELANQQFDASVRAKLNHFKQLTAAGKDY